jgi:hypothetical protein
MFEINKSEQALLEKIEHIATRPEMYGRDIQETCGILICLLEVLAVHFSIDPLNIHRIFKEKTNQWFPHNRQTGILISVDYKEQRAKDFVREFVKDTLTRIKTGF